MLLEMGESVKIPSLINAWIQQEPHAHPEENLQEIRRQIDEAKKAYDELEMKRGESLHDFEYRVKRHSVKILSFKVAGKVQRQLIEQEAREAEKQFKKKSS